MLTQWAPTLVPVFSIRDRPETDYPPQSGPPCGHVHAFLDISTCSKAALASVSVNLSIRVGQNGFEYELVLQQQDHKDKYVLFSSNSCFRLSDMLQAIEYHVRAHGRTRAHHDKYVKQYGRSLLADLFSTESAAAAWAAVLSTPPEQGLIPTMPRVPIHNCVFWVYTSRPPPDPRPDEPVAVEVPVDAEKHRPFSP